MKKTIRCNNGDLVFHENFDYKVEKGCVSLKGNFGGGSRQIRIKKNIEIIGLRVHGINTSPSPTLRMKYRIFNHTNGVTHFTSGPVYFSILDGQSNIDHVFSKDEFFDLTSSLPIPSDIREFSIMFGVDESSTFTGVVNFELYFKGGG